MATEPWGRKPVHLFVFTRQSKVWRYCSGSRDLVIDGFTYVASQIERGEIKQTVERAKDSLSITFSYLLDPAAPEYPATQILGDNWYPFVPTDPVTVTCLSYDALRSDAPLVEWIGEVIQPKFGDAELELTCEPDNGYKRSRNQGPRWQRACWKTVYSTGPRGCNLNKGAGIVTAVVTKIESTLGDVPPRAHILAPAFASLLPSLKGRAAAWETLAGQSSSEIVDAYFAYDERIVLNMPGSQVDKTTFYWDDAAGKVDHTRLAGPFGTFVAYFYYKRYAALVIENAADLEVGSVIAVETPKLGAAGVVSIVDALSVTAVAFAESAFSLSGGYLTFVDGDGLLVRCEIASHELGSETLVLQPGGRVPSVGDEVTALPTCARTWDACSARMNTAHYGGSIYKPVKSPLDGVSMSWG